MSEKYVELPRDAIEFYGETERERKANEIIYDLTLEIDKLQQENKELKEKNATLMSSLVIVRTKYNNDKARYRRKYKRYRNILIKLESWLEGLGLWAVLDKLKELKGSDE